MIQFIYGTNRFLIQQKLRQIEADFALIDTSGINLDKLDGANLTLSALSQALSAMPFLAPKRLAIIKNLLLDNKDADLLAAVAGIVTKTSDQTDLIFVEMEQPDKRTKLYKTLLKVAEVYEAVPLEGGQLIRYITEKFGQEGVVAESGAAEYLARQAGNDMQRLEQEIVKISLYVKSKNRNKLEISDIDLLIVAETDPNVFAFTEAVAKKDARSAARLLGELLENGENEQKLLANIAYQFRTLIIIKDALQRGMNSQDLAGPTKLNPYVISKNLPLARVKSMRSLVVMYENLRKTDGIIKSSTMPADLALNILVATLCR